MTLGITNLSLAKAARARKTLLLTGKFSPDGPTLSLFTNADRPDTYLRLFDAAGPLTYGDFNRIIKPKIGMYRMELGDRFAPLMYKVPEAGTPSDGTPATSLTLLAPDDPLFLQGMAYTAGTRADAAHEEAGRAFFRKLVAGLDAFSTARPQHASLVLVLAKLLERCASQHGLPAYNGGPLPSGLPEAFIDLLYSDDRAKFLADSLDLDAGIWNKYPASEPGRSAPEDAAILRRNTLVKVASALRDEILEVGKDQFNGVVFSGGSLSALAKEVLRGQEGLVKKFRAGRTGRQFVADTLRSPPRMGQMLMMVLKAAYERVEKVRGAFQDQYEADSQVEAEICSSSGEVLAAAVKRPDGEQRRVFAAEMKSGFRGLILAVVADDKDANSAIAKLSKPLQELANSIRADAGRRKLIVAISGAASGAEMTEAFVQAVQMVIGDTLLPALYRSPVLDIQDVKQQLRSALMSLYLASVLMGDKNDAAIKAIAVKRLSAFEEHIDKIGKPGVETQQVVKLLLDDVLGVLARPEAAEQLTEGIRVLAEALAVYDAAEQDKEENLFRALREKLEGSKANAITRTHASRKRLERRVTELVRVAVRNKAAAQAGGAAAPAAKKKGAAAQEAGKKSASQEEAAPASSEHLKKIDELVAAVMPTQVPATEQPAVVAAVVEKAMADERFVSGLDRDLEAFDGIAWLIFSRYADPRNSGKVEFRRGVQRLSLLDIILQDQSHLELGRKDSWMYQLLLDMVDAIGEGLDPSEFVRTKSFTLYFDNQVLADGGVAALRQALELMGEQSRKNLAGLIGELYGVKHLFDSLADDAEVEIIVFNGTPNAFLQWLKKDSLTPNAGKGLMRLGGLLTPAENRRIVPGAMLLSGGDVKAFLAALKAMKLCNSGFAVVLPPVIASTGPQSDDYVAEGMQMVAAAAGGPAALTVVGPGIELNPADSPFPTHIPAGYPLAAHFLGQPEQGLRQENVARLTDGRFHAVGYGTVGLETSLDQVLWGEASLPDGTDEADEAVEAADGAEAAPAKGNAGHCLEADLFAYLMLQAAGGVAYSGNNVALDAKAFYGRFYSKPEDPASETNFLDEIECLGPALHGNDARRMCFDSNLADDRETPPTLTIADLSGPNLANSNATRRTVRDLAWIPAARKAAKLP